LHSEAHTYLNTFAILKDKFKINLGNGDKNFINIVTGYRKKNNINPVRYCSCDHHLRKGKIL
jgi:hypothetical protein